MNNWLRIIAVATCAMLGAGAAGAEELSSCIAKTVRFDGIAPLTYATVQGAEFPPCAEFSGLRTAGERRRTGFARLTRAPLDAKEVTSLFNQVYNFTRGTRFEDNTYIFPANGDPNAKPVVKPTWPLELIQETLGRELFVWGYRPQVDIDNDGIADDLIVWQGQGAGGGTGACGDYGLPPTPQVAFRQAQLALVLTNGRFDPARTLATFGHPVQAYTATDTRGHSSQFKPHFRPVGTSIGIFEYRGQYYFDSFFDIWGDFADQRRDRPSLANTLGVFQRSDGATRQICEYQVDGQNYPTSKTWEVLP